jgi:hypothetical protein
MAAKDSLLIQYRLGLVSDDLWEIERRNISNQMEWARKGVEPNFKYSV